METRGKHDKSNDYETARIEELENRLEFANETINRLQAELKKYNRWISEVEANKDDEVAYWKGEVAKRDAAILKLVVK